MRVDPLEPILEIAYMIIYRYTSDQIGQLTDIKLRITLYEMLSTMVLTKTNDLTVIYPGHDIAIQMIMTNLE